MPALPSLSGAKTRPQVPSAPPPAPRRPPPPAGLRHCCTTSSATYRCSGVWRMSPRPCWRTATGIQVFPGSTLLHKACACLFIQCSLQHAFRRSATAEKRFEGRRRYHRQLNTSRALANHAPCPLFPRALLSTLPPLLSRATRESERRVTSPQEAAAAAMAPSRACAACARSADGRGTQ